MAAPDPPVITRPNVLVVGAGAAGIATAILTARRAPGSAILVLDGAKRPGAKILVSGGSRCNVTNVRVGVTDFNGGRRSIIRRVLRALTVDQTITFFSDLGVRLHEEASGKLFPDSNRARDVLDALFHEAARLGVEVLADHRVTAVARNQDGFTVVTTRGALDARHIVLATGGLSLPKSGSDGLGLDLARRFGHTIVPTTPALVPLVMSGDFHRGLQGVSHPVELALWVDGGIALRLTGAMLWTHFGASGPVVLDMSRHWLRAELEDRAVRLTASFVPGAEFDVVDRRWTTFARRRPTAGIHATLSGDVPAALSLALLDALGIDRATALGQITRDERRRLVHALTAWDLPVVGSRGYTFAEATAGGVALTEIDPASMESRVCPGLFLVGEMLDLDGRIGGFNFQWAWSSAAAAASALSSR